MGKIDEQIREAISAGQRDTDRAMQKLEATSWRLLNNYGEAHTNPENLMFSPSVQSEWECYLFGTGAHGLALTPEEGKVPNWFWRQMQYLCFGNKWVKEKDNGL